MSETGAQMSHDLDLQAAWAMLETNEEAVLIDVRTQGEWSDIGTPDLESIGKSARLVEWVMAPDGRPNPDFLAQAGADLDPDQPILLLCRSGARSHAAGMTMAAAGFTKVHNVVAGFEGPVGPSGQHEGGWKDHLPSKTP